MLAITDNASEAIKAIVQASDLPAEGGLRIAAGDAGPDGATPLELSLTDEPAEADAVVDEAGARVFLDPNAAALLEDQRLDAQIDGERVGFVLGPQGGDAPSSMNGDGPA